MDLSPLLATNFENPFSRGKVRDTYALGDALMMVATDRISAFDVVLPSAIPDKGRVLTQMSAFWFEQTAHLIPNHFLELVEDPEQCVAYCTDGYCPIFPPAIVGRTMIVKRAEPLPIECVVRGYLAGSGWAEYQQSGTLNGLPLPPGMVESQELDEPVFTPSTKAHQGHDVALSPDEARLLVGSDVHEHLEAVSIALYTFARDYARERGIIIADTKFEFGLIDGQLTLIDEALTPDSSRFWPLDQYEPGRAQHSYDKQFVRDWLNSSGWDRQPPAPALPEDIISSTAERYREAFARLTGRQLIP
jgi:phosphoribosylaminoimidazole-succinocarboxamide synthase